MWMKTEVTLSNEWKTRLDFKEWVVRKLIKLVGFFNDMCQVYYISTCLFLHVIIAHATGPLDKQNTEM
jgi:hypothetical protein